MINSIHPRVLPAFSLLLLLAQCSTNDSTLIIPQGWYAGEQNQVYECGVPIDGVEKNVATIRFIGDAPDSLDCGTMMQTANPDPYKGKRVSITGHIKAREVAGWAGFWMRIEQKDSFRMQYFDNMEDRGITGTTDWRDFKIVLDMPQDAQSFTYGGILVGAGQIWFTSLKFDTVSQQIPITSISSGVVGSFSHQMKVEEVDYSRATSAQLLAAKDERRKSRLNCSEGLRFGSLPTPVNLSFEK